MNNISDIDDGRSAQQLLNDKETSKSEVNANMLKEEQPMKLYNFKDLIDDFVRLEHVREYDDLSKEQLNALIAACLREEDTPVSRIDCLYYDDEKATYLGILFTTFFDTTDEKKKQNTQTEIMEVITELAIKYYKFTIQRTIEAKIRECHQNIIDEAPIHLQRELQSAKGHSAFPVEDVFGTVFDSF